MISKVEKVGVPPKVKIRSTKGRWQLGVNDIEEYSESDEDEKKLFSDNKVVKR